MKGRHWFAILAMSWLALGGLIVLDGILKLFALPSNLAVLGGILALTVLAAVEYYGFRLAVKILRKKDN